MAERDAGKAATVEGIGTLYQRRFHAFLRVAEAIVGDPELARDVVQDAFARAIRSRFDYRGEGTLDGWVWQTVVNAARNARRDRPPQHLPLQDVANDAAERANGRPLDSEVRALVAALPERQRLVLFLRYYADLDSRKIGEALADGVRIGDSVVLPVDDRLTTPRRTAVGSVQMALDDFDLDPTTADAVIALADPRLRAEAITRLDGGANSAVFDVRTTGGELVVKVYSDLFHWKMEKEVLVHRLLRGHALAVPVPVVLAADDSKTLLSQNVLVMTKLNGEHVLSLVDRLDDNELAHVNRQIGAFLRSLHEIGFDQFGYVGTDGIVGPHDTNLAYMRFQFAKKLREFADLGGDDELRRKIEHHVAAREELLADCPRASYCHNDCHYGNVLVLAGAEGWEMSGMLDFENVLAGDPLLDLAKAHCYSPRRNERLLAALIEGYSELRPNWREALDLYVLYHWLELWDWFASLGQTEALDELADEMRLLTA